VGRKLRTVYKLKHSEKRNGAQNCLILVERGKRKGGNEKSNLSFKLKTGPRVEKFQGKKK